MSALVSELPRVNGWSIARHGRDRTPDRTQRLLNHASWDTPAAMSVVRRFAADGLELAARRGRRGGMTVGAIDETGQEKAGEATAGVKRQYLGCAGKVVPEPPQAPGLDVAFRYDRTDEFTDNGGAESRSAIFASPVLLWLAICIEIRTCLVADAIV